MNKTIRSIGVIVLAAGALPPSVAWGYQASCAGTPLTATITSVLGEPRFTTPSQNVGTPDRFHGGVDIAECDNPDTVQSIEAGTVFATTACGNGKCLRVKSASGHAFDYVHIEPTVSVGSTVAAGATIGTIVSGGDHLHLNEIQPILGTNYRVNPQRPGALQFSDSNQPVFVSTSLGAVSNQSIILVEEGTATPFRFRSNTYFLQGSVDVFINARDGSFRKGLYQVGVSPRTAGQLYLGNTNITFNTLHDSGGTPGEVQTIYYYRNSDSDTFIPTNKKINYNSATQVQNGTWNTDVELPGAVQLCGNLMDYPQGHTKSQCVNTVIDRTPPTITLKDSGGTPFTGATNSTSVEVQGDDDNGIYSIKLEGVSYSSTNYVSGVQDSASNTFPDSGDLDDGSYTATVLDLAGNQTSAAFKINTVSPTLGGVEEQNGIPLGYSFNQDSCFELTAQSANGEICLITISGPDGFISTITFSPPTSEVKVGKYCGLDPSSYTVHVFDCAGNSIENTVFIATQEPHVFMTGYTPLSTPTSNIGISLEDLRTKNLVFTIHYNGDPPGGLCASRVQQFKCACETFSSDFVIAGSTGLIPVGCDEQPEPTASYSFPTGAKSYSFNIKNTTDVTSGWNSLTIRTGFPGVGTINTIDITQQLDPGDSFTGTVQITQLEQSTFSRSNPDTITIYAPVSNITISSSTSLSDAEEIARLRQVLVLSSPKIYNVQIGSAAAVIYNSTITVQFHYPDTVGTDTTTLHVYGFDGTQWERDSLSHETIEKNGDDIVATVWSTHTAIYAAFFDNPDSSAPITSFSIDGSTNEFDGILYIASSAYVVLTATDPLVNGFSSTVATTYYRIDGDPSDGFSVYTASIALTAETHFIHYKSEDYAGNMEVVRTSTVTVSIAGLGTMRSKESYHVTNGLLIGYITTGAQLEAQADTLNDYVIRISSPDGSEILNTDNIGNTGVGTDAATARLDIAGTSDDGDIALQLRSGNSTGSTASYQMTFGYDGTDEMRHAILTQHNLSTSGNRMAFRVWEPDIATTSVAQLDIMSLEAIDQSGAGSVHIRPIGIPDVELEVSNGITTGGGDIVRWATEQLSSRDRKTDIQYLPLSAEAQALQDISSLRPATFRYKRTLADGFHVRDPGIERKRGLIYEDSPKSIQGPHDTIILNDRITNIELALKSAIKRMERLQNKLKKLKGRTP